MQQSLLVCIIHSHIFFRIQVGIVAIAHTSIVVQCGYGKVDSDLLVAGIDNGLAPVDAEAAQFQRNVQTLLVAAL